MHKYSSNELSALSAVVFSAIAWGLTGIFVRILSPISPLTLTCYRLIIAMVITFPAIMILRKKIHFDFRSLRIPATWILSILLVGYYLLATTAFQLAPVGEVALLLSVSPVFVLIFKYSLGITNYRNEYIGAIIAITGISIIVLPGLSFNGFLSQNRLIGDILSISAAALTAIYATWFRALNTRSVAPDSLIVASLTFALGGAFLTSYIVFFSKDILITNLNGGNIITYMALGIFCTAMPTIGFSIASKRLPSIITTTSSLLVPVFASLFSFLIIGEQPHWTMLPGSFLILGGLGLMIMVKK